MARQTFAGGFGSNLAQLRREADLSQEELGIRASMHRTAVGQLERGERVARTDSLVKLAASLGVDPCRLLAGLSWTPATYAPGSFGISEQKQSKETGQNEGNETRQLAQKETSQKEQPGSQGPSEESQAAKS